LLTSTVSGAGDPPTPLKIVTESRDTTIDGPLSTITLAEPDTSRYVARIVAVPGWCAVKTPFSSTEAMLGSSLVHRTLADVSSSSRSPCTVAIS
jgi:hypothetical protein